jgi:hypothetical protein
VLVVNLNVEQCNLSVAHLEPVEGPEFGLPVIAFPGLFDQEKKVVYVKLVTEYGQTDAFEKIA